MTDPNTLVALAREFKLEPDTVRLIMDAAEQHPGVVDPLALGRSWLRKRASYERGSVTTPTEPEPAETARVDAASYVAEFFDSVGYSDTGKRTEWERWAASRADEGWTREAIVAHVKARWEDWNARNSPLARSRRHS